MYFKSHCTHWNDGWSHWADLVCQQTSVSGTVKCKNLCLSSPPSLHCLVITPCKASFHATLACKASISAVSAMSRARMPMLWISSIHYKTSAAILCQMNLWGHYLEMKILTAVHKLLETIDPLQSWMLLIYHWQPRRRSKPPENWQKLSLHQRLLHKSLDSWRWV